MFVCTTVISVCLGRNWRKREKHFHQADEDHPWPRILGRGQERLHSAGLPEHLHSHASYDPGHEHVTDPLQVWKQQGRPDHCFSVRSLLLHTVCLRKRICQTPSHLCTCRFCCLRHWQSQCLVLQSCCQRVLSIYGVFNDSSLQACTDTFSSANYKKETSEEGSGNSLFITQESIPATPEAAAY